MPRIGSICILVALAVTQLASGGRGGIGLDELRDKVKRITARAEAVVDDLARLRGNARSELARTSSSVKDEATRSLDNVVDEALRDIRLEVDEATSQGKNVEHCYLVGSESLRNISRNGAKALDNCASKSGAALEPIFENIEATAQMCRQLIVNVNAVFDVCYSSDSVEMTKCVRDIVGWSSMASKNLGESAYNYKKTVEMELPRVRLRSESCSNSVVADSSKESIRARLYTHKCIE